MRQMQGAVPGSKKRCITLRKGIFPQTSRNALEEIKLKVGLLWSTALIPLSCVHGVQGCVFS